MGENRQYVYVGVGIALIVVGSLATGLLPGTLPYQAFAGGLIVLGCVVAYAAVGAFDFGQ